MTKLDRKSGWTTKKRRIRFYGHLLRIVSHGLVDSSLSLTKDNLRVLKTSEDRIKCVSTSENWPGQDGSDRTYNEKRQIHTSQGVITQVRKQEEKEQKSYTEERFKQKRRDVTECKCRKETLGKDYQAWYLDGVYGKMQRIKCK